MSATQLYGPYGSVRYQSGALPTSYGYTHQRSDAVSGLDYYGARYYDPLAGQFTSADTTLAGGLNRYAYVGGNPETWVDPSGHAQREGAEGEAMIVLGGDGNDVGAGSSLGDTGAGGVDPVLSVTYNGPETTYGAGTDGAVHFDVQNGQIDGVDGADGQILETNAQIEAQAEANANDVLHQSDRAQSNGQEGVEQGSSGKSSKPLSPVSQALKDAMRQNYENQKAQWNARDATRPGEPTYTMSTVVYEGAYNETSDPIFGSNARGHAEAQGSAQATGVVQNLVANGAEGDVQITIISGNNPCSECQSQLSRWAEQIQEPARGSNLTVNVQFVGQWAPEPPRVNWYTFPW